MPEKEGLVFPYAIRLREGGIIETFPAAEVFFYSKEKEKLSLFFIIDSGATISAFPKSDAKVFGIKPETGIPQFVSGIGGEVINGWKHKVVIYLKEKKLQLPVIFLDNESAPRVLGREGVFDRFIIVFEEEKMRTGFLEKNSLPARNVQKILNKFTN